MAGPAATEFAAAEYLRFYDMEPQEDGANGKTWLGRGQNFIIAYTEAKPDSAFSRKSQADEYAVLLPWAKSPATITWQGETEAVSGYSIVFVPPGHSTVTMPEGGRLIRMFTTRSEDLATACANAGAYAEYHPNIPPFEPWPEPQRGYRVRS